jgi:hypothetical protein
MGNKSSTSNPSSSEGTIITIEIAGFGGDTTLPANIVGELPKLTGKYVISQGKIDRSRIPIPEIRNNPTPLSLVEVATLTTTEPQEIIINDKKYTVTPHSYSISQRKDGKYKLSSDSKDLPLSTLIVPVSMGVRRKRQTKGRKAKKHSRRRRSIRA